MNPDPSAEHHARSPDLELTLAETLGQRVRELEHQWQRATALARLKEAFLARISHELRTPLHAMLGFADLVADGIQGPVTAEQHDSLSRVRVNGERLVGMVDHLVEVAKLPATTAPAPQPFDPSPLLNQAAAFAGDAAALKGLRFSYDLPRSVPWVLGTRGGTAVAVRQLLDNAVRFTDEGAVELRVRQVQERLRIEIRDGGPGIPAGEIEGAFEPFCKEDGGDIALGLTLAREAIQYAGGALEQVHGDTTGNAFALELPLAHGPKP